MLILAASDLHIGRIPALPGNLDGVTGRSAWEAVVRCALTRKVEVVLLAGDVVEGVSAQFEAYGPLKKGLAQLREAGIQVLAVAGNHDARVFPQLAGDSGAVRILGLGGLWEAFELGPIRILGWSFPETQYRNNPMDRFDEGALAGGRPYLGLLHCDLDGAAGSPYAPVPARNLELTGAASWVLGHIHKGEPRAGDRAFYCGSPFALDAGEEGEHGAWLLDISDHGTLRSRERIALSPWRFTTLEVDLEAVETFDMAMARAVAAMEGAAASDPGGSLFCSLRLRGACGLSGVLARKFEERLPELDLTGAGGTVRPTGRVIDATTPLLPVAELAQGHGIRGILARIIQQAAEADRPMDELPELLAKVAALLPAGSNPEQARQTLATAARRLLQTVEAQRKAL
jgi:hypothetical protein